ncbi:alpha/beta-hydrolase [Trametes gibbosa]|nr:alpha/beta-hydrolase [Trametes gibbosa]
MDPSHFKSTTVSRGFTYRYFHAPAAPGSGKPTLLFLHGFPSSAYDWHLQIEHFHARGFGLLVPDLLGAGGTSKPDSADAFRFVLMARDIVDLLDTEGLQTVVGIAHDWGSALLSRLANLYSERFHGFAWLVLSYIPPRWQDWAIGQKLAKTDFGGFGYWEFFISEDAPHMCAKNIDCFMQLVYPVNPDDWKDWLLPQGKTRQWVQEDRKSGLPPWLPQEEYDVMREILAKAGLRSIMNYYKAMVDGLNDQDSANIPEEAYAIRKPALFIAAARDAVCTATEGKAEMAKYAPHATIVELNTGHWVQFEETKIVNDELERWVETL